MPTILFIDDDKDSQEIYSTLLKEKKYKVLQAFDGNAGIQLARESHPDLIILDIMLPPQKTNGFDILEFLKKNSHLKHIPVIIFTNVDTEKQTAKEIGAADYLVKVNTSADEFLAAVDKYVKKFHFHLSQAA